MRCFIEKEEEEDIFICNKSLFTHIYRERDRDYKLKSTLGSKGTRTLILHNLESCFSLSGIIWDAFAAFLKHSHKALRIGVVVDYCNIFCAPSQHVWPGSILLNPPWMLCHLKDLHLHLGPKSSTQG